MWKKLISGLLATFMLVSGIPVSALSIESDWIVEFRSEELAKDFLLTHEGRLLGGTMVLTRGESGDFDGRADVVSLTQDGRVKGAAVSFNDPRKNDQYYLTDNALNVTTAWNTLDAALADKGLTEADASPIRVAVIDTGVDGSHEDLKNRVTAGYDAVNGVALPAGTDSDVSDASHGTMVAGLIAAEANNSVGIAGVSYTLPVSIVPVRALDANANGKLSDIIAAIYWAVDEGNADIVNMSFGLRRQSRPAALEAAVNHAVDKGVTLIAAAGNEGRDVSYENYHYYPAALEGVLAVGSLTKSSYVRYSGYIPSYSSFTNRINTSSDVGKTFFYVAGENLLTTARGNTYDTFTGTSASAAVFSGMMASLMSVSRAIDGVAPQAVITTTNGGGYYSYRVSYHSFSVAASNLRSGRVMDAWWINDAHFPTLLRNSVEFSGTLMDPSYQMSGVRAVLIDGDDQVTELDAVPRIVDSVGQSVSFALDSTQVADGAYQLNIIGTYASPSSAENTEIMLYEQSVTIDNAGKNYLLSVWEDGEPLIGTELTLYNADGNEMQTGHTDSLGNYPVSATAADKGGVTVVTQGEECLHIDELETHPRDNAYLFNESPATLTLTASEETLARLGNLPLTLRLPDGSSAELVTITGGSTAVTICSNCPLTFTIRGDALSLSKEFSFADGDKVWNLDEELAAAATLTVQSDFVNADGVQMYVGSDRYRLPSDGGEIVLAPGEFTVKARVFKTDAGYDSEADYFEVDFGKVNLTADRTLNIGSAVTAQMTLGQEQVVQNSSLSASFTLRDTEGNTVSDIAHSWYVEDNDISGYTRLSNFGLRFERRQEDGAWEDLDNEFMNWKSKGNGVFSVTMDTATLDNVVGDYRVRLTSTLSWPMALSEDDWKPFTVTAEETRPAARVNLSFLDFNGYRDNNVGFYVQLQDENGNWIVRKAMKPSDYKKDETYYTYLPVGETYTGAVMATCYCETDALDGYGAATAVFTIDLTDKTAGDTVDITLQPDRSWQITRITVPSVADGETAAGSSPVGASDLPADGSVNGQTDGVDSKVSGVTVYPFAQLPDTGVTGSRSSYLSGIVSQNLGETAVDLTFRATKGAYTSDAVVTLTHDFSGSGSIAASLPLHPTLTGDQAEYRSGSDVTLRYKLLDSCGNAVKDVICHSNSSETASDGTAGTLHPTASVTVYRANGATVGQYTLSDVYADSVKLTGLADGKYIASVTVECPLLTATGETVTFTVGGESPVVPEKVVETPANFSAKAKSVSSIELSWDAPTDEIAGYVIYRDGRPFGEVAGSADSYLDEGITADRYYSYTLYAVDSEGDRSKGATAGSRPAARPDTTPPSVPTNLRATLMGSEVLLSWARSTDNVAVTNYIVTCDGTEVGRTYNRSFTHAGRLPGQTCVYTVSAMDGAGNRSAESRSVSVAVPNVSGITASTLTYPRNKVGNITGQTLTVNARATADIATVRLTVNFTLLDGTSDSLTTALTADGNGAWLGSADLPDEFASVEQATLTAYQSGETEAADTKQLLTSPVARANAFTVALTNTQNLTLPDFAQTVNVTLSGSDDQFSVTRTVEHYAGSFVCFPPNASDYCVTVTDEDGRELYVRTDITITDGGSFTADASDLAKSLRVKLTGLPDGVDMTGIAVSAEGRWATYTGVTDSQGYIIWSEGGQWLSVEPSKCYYDIVGGSYYLRLRSDVQTLATDDKVYEINGISEKCYVTDPVNEMTVGLDTTTAQAKTITAHIRDKHGTPAKGVSVEIVGKTRKTVITDENGTASAKIGLYTYDWDGTTYICNASVRIPRQTATDGRIWQSCGADTQDSCDITLTAQSNQFKFVPDIKVYQDGENKPVADSDAAGADWFARVNRYYNEFNLIGYNGEWSNSDLMLTDGDKVTVYLSAALGTRSWSGQCEVTFDSANPTVLPEIVMHEDSAHRLTLHSLDGDMLPGVDRRFLVYNKNEELLSDTVSHAAFADVNLPYGQPVTIVATFDTTANKTLFQWHDSGKWAECVNYTNDGSSTPMTLKAKYGADFDDVFWCENGFSRTPAQYHLPNGDWRVGFHYTAWDADGTKSKSDYIILPEGAYNVDINYFTDCASYNEEEHTITIDQKKIVGRHKICNFSFSIPAEKLAANPRIVAWFETTFINGKDYTSLPYELNLRLSGVNLGGGNSVCYDDLTDQGGYPLTVRSQLYGQGKTISIYDGDTLLVYQAMPSAQLTFDLPLTKDIGTHELRVVVSDGTVEDETVKEVDVVYDDQPVIDSVYVTCSRTGGMLVGKGSEYFSPYYTHRQEDHVSVRVQAQHSDLIEKMWAVVSLSKGSVKINLTKKNDNGLYEGSSVCGSANNPVTGIEVKYLQKPDTPDTVQGSIDFDTQSSYYDIAYWEGPTEEQREAHLVSVEDNSAQAQALSDWEKYVDLIRNGEHMDSDEFYEKLDDVYGDDGEWTLPIAKGDNGEELSMTFIKESERAAEFLASDDAFTVLVDGEKVRMGYEIEFCENGEDIIIHYYGDLSLFYPRVPESDTVSADWFWEKDYGGHQPSKLAAPVVKPKKGGPSVAGELLQKGVGLGNMYNGYKDNPDYSQYYAILNDPCATPAQKMAAQQKLWIKMGQHAGDLAIDTISQIGPDETDAGTWGHMALGGGLGVMGKHWDDINAALNEDPTKNTSPCDGDDDGDDDDDDDDDDGGNGDGNHKKKKKKKKKTAAFGHFHPLVDPSGNIFEAVADQPVQGVTATIYYKSSESGEWVKWDSEAYDQPSNPMLSHEDGYYGWDVLMGKWKVVFEKDGYFLAESEELDVPPEHTDVNISLVSSVAPTVKEFTAKADGGSVTLTFDKYMLTKDLLQTGAVNVTFGGVTPAGKLTAVNPKTTAKGNKQAVSASDIAGGDEVAKQFTYTFDDPLPTGATVNITVSDEAAAYNGMTLTEVYNGSVVVPESDPVVYADTMTFEDASLLDKAVGDTFKIGELTFNGTQPGAVQYESSDESVLTVDENGNVTAVGAGYATVWATCDTLEAGRPVQVTRQPVVPDESDNAVVFCRKDNLIWNKGCWMWSDGATYGDGDPVEGDGKYLALSWRILENGTEKAGSDVASGAIAVKEYYTPTKTGTLTGEITYQLYIYHEGKWSAVEGKTCTATKDMNVVTVTGLSVKTPPATVGIGDTLNLNELVLNVHTSDGLTSEVPYAKFYRWSLTPSTKHGTVLTKSDRVLTITHPDSGQTVDIELWASTEHDITITNDGNGTAKASVEKADPGDTVTLTATPKEHYRLKEWQVVSGKVTITDNQFTMPDTAVTIQAIFEPDHTLTHFAAVAAACETDGSIEYWHCDGCDRYFADAEAKEEITKDDIPIPAPGHDWNDGAVTQEPTCDKDGTKVYTCRHDASHTKTETVPALGHDLQLVPAVAATCTTDGHSAYYECQRCGKLFADGTAAIEITDPASLTIEALGHDWGEWVTVTPASENTAGLERRVCSRDATHEETRVLPKLPHTHVLTKTEEVPATCEEDGHTAYWTCNGCGKLFGDAEGNTEIQKEDTVIAAIGHDWDNGVVTTEPTCTEDGVKTFTCRRDASHTKTEPVAKLGHELKLVPAVPATCESDGHSAYYDCTRCDRHFADAAGSEEVTDLDALVIPATGHAYGSPVWKWDADHTATLTLTCSHDAVHVQNIPAIVTRKLTEPACETDGVILYTALVTFDGVTYTDNKTESVPATGHKLTLTAAVEPTCEKNGSTAYYVCEHCGKWFEDATASVEITDKSSVVIPALGHDYGNPAWNWSADDQATVSFTCRHDDSHVKTVTATVTSERTEPTCLHDGQLVYTATAKYDGRTYTNTNTVRFPALGHELHLIPAVAPTCEKGGNIEYYLCERCNKLFADAEGKTKIKLEDTILPAKQHDWNGGVVTTEPTCTEDGVKTFTCLNDPNHTKTESVLALGHKLRAIPEMPAACESEGRMAYYECKTCGKYFADATGLVEITDLSVLTIPAIGHAYGKPSWHWSEENAATAVFTCEHDAAHTETVTATVTADKSEADCEKAGRITYTAAVIFGGKTYTDSKTVKVPALGHKLKHVEAIPATCETDGHTEHWICTQCGKYLADESGATEISADDVIFERFGHDWDDGVVTLAPTCETDGVKTYICKHDASHTCTEVIPATRHTLTFVPAVPATCETDGSIAYYVCDTCGKRYADGTAAVEITGDITVPALGHDWGMWLVTKPATESEEGLEVRICQHDPSHSETRVIPALGHMHKLTKTEAVAATCEADGHIAYWTCDGCGRLFADAAGAKEIEKEDTILVKLGHDWDNGVVTLDPTCEEDGVRTYTCRNDASHTRTEVISATGHELRLVPSVAATCETDGHKAYYECEICGKLFADIAAQTEITFYDTVIPAIGHRYGEPVWTWHDDNTVEAVFTCANDAAHTPTLSATVMSETVQATCEADGKTVYTATVAFEGKTYTDSKIVLLPALHHDWDDGVVELSADGSDYVVRFTCRNDASHTRISPLNLMPPSEDYYYYTVHTSYPQNSDEDARFVVKRRGDDTATYSKFLGIAVDHRNVAPDCYVTFPGSVVIDLKAFYLRTLAVGKHTLRVIFTDGYVDTSFMITAAASTPAQPVTPVQPTPAAPHKPVPTPVEPTPAVPDKPVPAPVEPTPAAPDTGKSDSPRTGEGSFAAVWLMMSASLCAMFTAIRKRREEA